MLRFARVPLRMKTGQSTVRQCSSKPTNGNKVPQQATSAPKVESKQHPEVDPNFKSKFTGFMVIQSVLLAFFGVAYKMEEDEAFEAKIESHYANLSFLKPTMNTFREVIRVVQPPVKKTPPPSIDAFVPLAEEPIPESTNNNEIVAKEEFTPVVEEVDEVDAVEALHEPEDEPESEPIVEITPSGPTDEEIEALRLKQEEEEKAQQLRKEQEEQLQKKLDELEAKTKAFQLELEASAAKAAEAENQVVVLPTVDAENRMHDVRVETSELALEEMSRYANKTRQDLQMSLLQNLSSLDEAELRERITQLAAEFFERTKWEGLRLHESLKQLEGELTDKYTGIMNEQRAELQVELEKALLQREKEIMDRVAADKDAMNKNIETAVASAVLAQATGFHASQQKQLDEQREQLSKAFEEEYTRQLALVKHGQVQELLKVEATIDQLKSQLAVYQEVIDDVATTRDACKRLHAQSAAVLCLDDVVRTSKPLAAHVESVKRACEGDELIASAIDTIPSRGMDRGVLTLAELRVRFKVVRKEVRKASLIPEYAPNFLGQMVGSVLASVSWSPAEDAKVDHTTVADGKDVEDHLATIAFHLDGGNLVQALREVDHIQGYPRMLINDWETCLSDRIVTEQAVSIIKSNIALKHHQNA